MARHGKDGKVSDRPKLTAPVVEHRGGDPIDIDLDREVLLLAAASFGGKSYSVVKLLEDSTEFDFNVVLLDRDRGVRKVWKELYGAKRAPGNLEYFRIDKWSRVDDGIHYALTNLKQGDWLVVEQMGFIYDFCVTAFFERQFGESKAMHTLALRAAAQAAISEAGLDLNDLDDGGREAAHKILMRSTGFGGLDVSAWMTIKEMYNDDNFVKAIVAGDFNILYTTGLGLMSARDKKDKRLEAFAASNNRPTGDRDLIAHMDTIAVGYKAKTGEHLWRTSLPGGRGKDRGGRTLLRDVSYEKVGFVASYFEAHELSLEPRG